MLNQQQDSATKRPEGESAQATSGKGQSRASNDYMLDRNNQAVFGNDQTQAFIA